MLQMLAHFPSPLDPQTSAHPYDYYGLSSLSILITKEKNVPNCHQRTNCFPFINVFGTILPVLLNI